MDVPRFLHWGCFFLLPKLFVRELAAKKTAQKDKHPTTQILPGSRYRACINFINQYLETLLSTEIIYLDVNLFGSGSFVLLFDFLMKFGWPMARKDQHVMFLAMTDPWDEFGIFTYMKTTKINHSCRWIYRSSHGWYMGQVLPVKTYHSSPRFGLRFLGSF